MSWGMCLAGTISPLPGVHHTDNCIAYLLDRPAGDSTQQTHSFNPGQVLVSACRYLSIHAFQILQA